MKWLIQHLLITQVLWQSFTQGQQDRPKIVCYLRGSSFQNGFSFKMIQNDSRVLPCTHIIYSQALLNEDDKIVEVTPSDVDGIQEIMDFKNNSITNVKVMLQIGKETDSGRYSRMTADPTVRTNMVDSIIRLVHKYDFDGVDFNWRYPGVEEAEKKNYLSLAQAIKSAFELEAQSNSDKVRRLISMVVPNLRELIVPGYNILALNSVIDFVNLIGYDFVSAASPWLDHHAPIKVVSPDFKESSLEFMARLYLRVGLFVRKLVLGIPLFGRRYRLDPSNNSTVLDTDSVPYNQICKMFEDDDVQVIRNNNSGPFIYKSTEVISYDDEESISKKAKLASNFKLGGVMFWSMDMGDWNASCPGNSKMEILPLIQVANTVIEEGIPKISSAYGSAPYSYQTEDNSSNATISLDYNPTGGSNYPTGSNPSYPLPNSNSNQEIPLFTVNRPHRPVSGMSPFRLSSLLPPFGTVYAGKDIVLEDIAVEINENHWPRGTYRPV